SAASDSRTAPQLKQSLGLATATSLVVGCVIGAGVFFKPYAIYQATGGGPGMGMLAWVLGGLVTIFGALTFAEVAVMIPRTGGMVAYLSEAFDRRVGFLAGWMQIVIFYPAYLAGYGVKVGEELGALLGAQFAMPIAIGTIIAIVAANVLGSRTASVVQVVSTACKLVPLFILMVFGFVLGGGGNPVVSPLVGPGASIGGALGSTLLAVLFAFEGWTNVGAISGELRNPARDLPRAIVGGVSIIMAVYLLINLAYLWVIPADQLMNLPSPAAAVAEKLFGPAGGALIHAGIIISVIGAANGFLMSGSRVAYLLADERMIPGAGSLSRLNGRQVPANSIILVGFLACLYSMLGQFDLLTNLGTFSCWVFYTLTFAAVVRLRRTRPEARRDYRVPLYPVVPALAIASGAYVIVSQIFLSGIGATLMALAGVAITLAGLPVYALVRRNKR
ncbi:MAG: amino acid permease, partial [Parafannyhessea umbonata]|nr:amino acid permease [Parafannyhessea umbonata]